MLHKPPFLELNRPPPAVDVAARDDGALILRNPRPLPDYPGHIIDVLDGAAERYDGRTFLAKRDAAGDWQHLTYQDASRKARIVAQWLIGQGMGQDRPVMILSGNSLEHAVMLLGAMVAGAPAAPVSVAYSMLSEDFAKLRHVFNLVQPGLIFVQDGRMFQRALDALDLTGIKIVYVDNAPDVDGAVPFSEVMKATPGKEAEQARAAQTPDTVAKILFTSGSTGLPKGVINTQRMLCCVPFMVQEMAEPENPDEPVVLLDWLPWNHTFGGNANFNGIMPRGGTIYIDDGLPTPERFHLTIKNLHEISPTRFSTVPAAYAMLADALEQDDGLCTKFFSRMRLMSYGGAPMSQDLYERMEALAVKSTGKRIPFSTGHGATETGAFDMAVYWTTERMGLIGLPAAGTELKLVPAGDVYEVRVKGPQVLPGYYKRDDLTRESFDEEGYFKLGDAARWADPDDPKKGLVFAGRLSENYKLSNGTWVSTGALRTKLLAALSPLVFDLLLTGDDYIAILAWPSVEGIKAVAKAKGLPVDLDIGKLLFHPDITEEFRKRLVEHNSHNGAASTRVGRFMLMTEPPSIDANEITDKRYINQRASLERRAGLVKQLLANPPDRLAIVLN